MRNFLLSSLTRKEDRSAPLEVRVVFLFLDDGVADRRREIGVAPHPDGNVEVGGLRRGHVVVGIDHDDAGAVILGFRGEMGVRNPHGDEVLGPPHEAVGREPVVQIGADPADQNRVARGVSVAHHSGDGDELPADQPSEPLRAALGKLRKRPGGGDHRSRIFQRDLDDLFTISSKASPRRFLPLPPPRSPTLLSGYLRKFPCFM